MVAGAVTVAAFGVATWISGAFLLPLIMKSVADRWVVAAGLGVAVAALAALGCQSWVIRPGRPTHEADGATGGLRADTGLAAPRDRSIAAGGDISGIASTGDDTTNTQYR